MGAWGTGLYSNDTSADMLDECRNVYSVYSVEEGTELLCRAYLDEMMDDEDETCHFWYTLADFQWKKGILQESVKEKALEMLEREAGMDLWLEEGNKTDIKKRREVLQKLKEKLQTPQPPKKKIKNPRTMPKYKIGDIICCYFTDKGIAEWASFFKLTTEQLSYKMIFLCVGEQDCGTYSCILKDVHERESIYAIYDWKGTEVPEMDEIIKMDFLPTKSKDYQCNNIIYCVSDMDENHQYRKTTKVAKSMDCVERFKKLHSCNCEGFGSRIEDLFTAYDDYHKGLVKHEYIDSKNK